tara:strand:+ start:12922 stop:13389 length:468 start_codon:yes stop_codon:yes gene_type:complete
MPEAPSPDQIVPEEDIKPLMDQIDAILGAPGVPPSPGEMSPEEAMLAEVAPMAEGEAVAEDAAAEEAVAEEAGATDLSEMVELLGIDEAQAQALYDAAQSLDSLAGKPPGEVARMLADDFQLRMQVEKIAGMEADMMADAEMEAPMEAPIPEGEM